MQQNNGGIRKSSVSNREEVVCPTQPYAEEDAAQLALAAAARSVAADPHEPDGRLTLGDLLARGGGGRGPG